MHGGRAPPHKSALQSAKCYDRKGRNVRFMGEQVELTKQVAVGRGVKILRQCPDSTPPSLSSTGPGPPALHTPSISHGYPRKVRRR